MLTSLALIFISALSLGWIFNRLRLPALIGMLLTGLLLGPNILNLISPSLLSVSPDLRQMALVIILIRAGLSLDIKELRKAGRVVVLLCFVPALFEILAYLIFAPMLLDINLAEAALMGAVIAAVSPAVIVPKMLALKENGWGGKKNIPQIIVAAGSVDDVFVIVLFTIFLGFLQGEKVSALSLLNIPVSVVTGIVCGGVVGFLLTRYFKRFHLRDSVKVIIILSIGFLLLSLEHWLKNIVAFSGLLAVMTMSAAIFHYYSVLADRLGIKFRKLWIAAEIILFVLVGAGVEPKYVAQAGLAAILVILIGLVFRMAGVYASLIKTPLSAKERLFCMISFIPKATVQAAIGSVALALGLPCGHIILTVAVLAILITAPLGAFAIDLTFEKLLEKDTRLES